MIKPTKIHPYLIPLGDSLDKNAAYLTTADNGAGIKVSIATPLKEEPDDASELFYAEKIDRVSNALKAYLGISISITVYPYRRFNTDEDEAATPQDPRSLYLSQYDTNADGNGEKQ